MRKIKWKSKMEFSKKILIIAGTLNILVIAFTMVMIFITKDMTAFAYLVPSVGAEVATGTAFYYNKAKAENKIKLMKEYEVAPSPDNFNSF